MHRFATLVLAAAAFAAAFLTPPPDMKTPGGAPPARSGAMESLDFWSEARTYPDGQMAADRQYRAFEWARRAEQRKSADLPFDASAWNYIGPSNLSGRMLALAINPLNPNTIYAGSASGGLWRSFTGGLSGDWHRVSTGYPVLGVAAVAIDPTDTNRIYIGTGEVYRYGGTAGGLVVRTTRGSYGMGLLRTTDGGATWTKSLDWSYNQERGVQMIRINPSNPSSVWAATSEGIYHSTDAGGSWTNLLPIQMAQDILIHPADTSRMLASTGNLGLSNLVLKSTNAGLGWTAVTPTDFSGKTLLASYATNPDRVFASVADSTTGVGSLWTSTDFGDSWTMLSNHTTNNIFGVQGWYSHFVAVHPLDSSIVFHAGVPASRSTNGGITFSGVGGTYSDHHGYAWHPSDPNILYVANDDGVYRSTNSGQSFSKVSVNLATGQFYNGFSNSASDSLIALGQVQDHIPGYLYQGSDVWPASAADEVGWTAIDQTNDLIMYAGTRNGGSLRKSTNRGVNWGATAGGFSGLACWNAPFVVSPSSPSILYFGRSRIFKSTNGAGSWVATNGGAELDGNPALSMGISATNPDTVYVGTAPRVTRTHVYRTTNGGTSWTDVTGPLPDRHPLDIAVDPIDPARVWVGYGGYGTGHVYRTTDGGTSWTDVTGALPDIPVTALLVDPLSSQVVYLGTDIGVYVTTNSGGSWEPLNEGLPEAVLVSDLSMTPSNRTLRASTHGNSVFERKMPATLPSITSVVPSGGESWEVGSLQTISWSQTLVANVRIDYSTDDGASWTTIAASVPAWPDSYIWTVPPTLTTQGRVRVSSTADTLLAAQSAASFAITYDGVILQLEEEWNLVSLPMTVPDPSTQAVFPGATGRIWRFQGAYIADDTLEPGKGYWVKYSSPAAIPIGGDSILVDTIPLVTGWNLIGSISAPTPVGSVTVVGTVLTSSFFGYGSSGYFTASILEPGHAYWVKASSPGLLILGGGPILAGARPAAPAEAVGAVDAAGWLRLTDAAGRSARLTLARPGVLPVARFELPPPPPAGGFDVRSAGGSLLAPAPGETLPISVAGATGPLRISWDLPAGESYLLRDGRDADLLLSGRGSARLEELRPLSIIRDDAPSGTLPAAIALHQNYPNPFNPATRIRFDIPEGSGGRSSVRIYDAAGRLAATLADGPLAPGSHELEWDASGLPSGVYFCRLRTEGAVLTVKMLLMK